jgi:hypothetical protein
MPYNSHVAASVAAAAAAAAASALSVATNQNLLNLELQRWQLQGHDLSALEPLQQLQQLHTAQLDPWLVSDSALVDLATVLPSLQLVTRDGRVLVCAAVATAAAGGLASLEPQAYGGAVAVTAAALDGGSVSWLSAAVAARAAAGRLQDGSAGTPGSWLAAYSASSAGVVPTAAAAAAALAPAGSTSTGPGGSSSSRKKSTQTAVGSSSSRLHPRLLDYDERYRYTTEQLVGLRVSASGAGSAAAAGMAGVPGEIKSSSADSWKRTLE